MRNTPPDYAFGRIGVLARPEDRAITREFFELFKTPWEFYHPGRRYDVLLVADSTAVYDSPPLAIVYGSGLTSFDEKHRRTPGRPRSGVMVSGGSQRMPIHGRCVSVTTDRGTPELMFEDTREPAASVISAEGNTVVRVGYDLFAEIRFLLTTGQPPAHAAIPTLERHIALLRRWIVGAGWPLVELPPVPDGSPFIVCLTHDVDHPSIRLHRFDHTIFGFLHRALLGSIWNARRGRASLSQVRRNAAAALALPFVHLGWADDFWLAFDRYLEIEQGLGSTFFFIPTKGTPGRTLQGAAPRRRASAYGIDDVAERARMLAATGCEVGVHGIDAWIDSASGADERERVSRVSGTASGGVRMHWLYFDERTPRCLEDAGFEYDSTFGYNETVGFRAGTLQAFKPISARRLLELPLHIMDTALFYPSHLDLAAADATRVVTPLVDDAARYGGALTLNWHDRSIAPERLWDGFYVDLLTELKRRHAWFPTAAEAVAWFRRRRSARFEAIEATDRTVRVAATAEAVDAGPALTLRVHRPATGDAWPTAAEPRMTFTDVPFKDSVDARVEV